MHIYQGKKEKMKKVFRAVSVGWSVVNQLELESPLAISGIGIIGGGIGFTALVGAVVLCKASR